MLYETEERHVELYFDNRMARRWPRHRATLSFAVADNDGHSREISAQIPKEGRPMPRRPMAARNGSAALGDASLRHLALNVRMTATFRAIALAMRHGEQFSSCSRVRAYWPPLSVGPDAFDCSV